MYSFVGPCSRGRALRKVIFPEIWLACFLLLRNRRRGINSDSDRGRWLQVGRDSADSILLLYLYNLYLSHMNLRLPQFAVIIGISFLFFSPLGKIRTYRNRVSLYSYTQSWVKKADRNKDSIIYRLVADHCIHSTLPLSFWSGPLPSPLPFMLSD